MRWEDLFADLEAQLEWEQEAELAGEVAELAEAEAATVSLWARLPRRRDVEITVGVSNGATFRGHVVDAAPGWVVLGDGARRALIPVLAIAWLDGAGHADAGETGYTASRLNLGHALRGVADAETAVTVVTAARDLVGIIERVGADFVDILTSPQAVTISVPFAAILAVSG